MGGSIAGSSERDLSSSRRAPIARNSERASGSTRGSARIWARYWSATATRLSSAIGRRRRSTSWRSRSSGPSKLWSWMMGAGPRFATVMVASLDRTYRIARMTGMNLGRIIPSAIGMSFRSSGDGAGGGGEELFDEGADDVVELVGRGVFDRVDEGAGDDRAVGLADQPSDVGRGRDAEADHERGLDGRSSASQEWGQLFGELAAGAGRADERDGVDEAARPLADGAEALLGAGGSDQVDVV